MEGLGHERPLPHLLHSKHSFPCNNQIYSELVHLAWARLPGCLGQREGPQGQKERGTGVALTGTVQILKGAHNSSTSSPPRFQAFEKWHQRLAARSPRRGHASSPRPWSKPGPNALRADRKPPEPRGVGGLGRAQGPPIAVTCSHIIKSRTEPSLLSLLVAAPLPQAVRPGRESPNCTHALCHQAALGYPTPRSMLGSKTGNSPSAPGSQSLPSGDGACRIPGSRARQTASGTGRRDGKGSWQEEDLPEKQARKEGCRTAPGRSGAPVLENLTLAFDSERGSIRPPQPGKMGGPRPPVSTRVQTAFNP
ncbi:hypothetical protein AAY473_025333 [Plecturocebus cupreus]